MSIVTIAWLALAIAPSGDTGVYVPGRQKSLARDRYLLTLTSADP